MGLALSVAVGAILGGLLYVMPGGVIFGFPASLSFFGSAVVIGMLVAGLSYFSSG